MLGGMWALNCLLCPSMKPLSCVLCCISHHAIGRECVGVWGGGYELTSSNTLSEHEVIVQQGGVAIIGLARCGQPYMQTSPTAWLWYGHVMGH